MPHLVIVESPGKVKSIQKYLDQISPNQFNVVASKGHILKLESKLGFDPITLDPCYEVTPHQKPLVKQLQHLAKNSESVILASDADREGEAIAQHLATWLEVPNAQRAKFKEITPQALATALQNLTPIDKNLVDAQEVRRLMDRMIGWEVSPLAALYINPNATIGRVQTVVVLIIVEREKAISNFKVVDHFGVEAIFANAEYPKPWTATWVSKDWLKEGEQYWTDHNFLKDMLAQLKDFTVTKLEKKPQERSPSAPFITSSFQMAAQRTLGLSAKESMDVAQRLYEAGIISYMRTDNPNLSDDAYEDIKTYLEQMAHTDNIASDQEPLKAVAKKRTFNSKAAAQESHEAIRPTSFAIRKISNNPEAIEQKVYDLIRLRALASQLENAVYDTVNVDVEASVLVTLDGTPQEKMMRFTTKGSVLVKKGWLALTVVESLSENEEEEEDESSSLDVLANLKEGQVVTAIQTNIIAKKTTPPPRYSAVSIIKAIEQAGVGRPSTYASLVSSLEERGYITYEPGKKKIKSILPTKMAYDVIENMQQNFSFLDVKFTSEMETSLDDIAQGGNDGKTILRKFYEELGLCKADFTQHMHTRLPTKDKCTNCNSLLIKQEKEFDTQNGKISIALWHCSNLNKCRSIFCSNKDGSVGAEKIWKVTPHKCIECQANLIYTQAQTKADEVYSAFVCENSRRRTKPCLAKYDVINTEPEVLPDFEKYRAENKHKCLLCNNSLRLCHPADKTKSQFWVCVGVQVKKCSAYYKDKNGAPDFEHFKKNHTHKCFNCESYISYFEPRKEGDVGNWRCSNRQECNIAFADDQGQPNQQLAQEKYAHKCPNSKCKKGKLHFMPEKKGFSEKTGKDYHIKAHWECSISKDNGCGTRVDVDENNNPNLELYKKAHTHKCPNCKTYLRQSKKERTDGSEKIWFCPNNGCSVFLDGLNDKPDVEKFAEKYPHGNCPKCKTGLLVRLEKNDKSAKFFKCSTSKMNNEGCDFFAFAKADGTPDLDSQKKGGKKKAKGGDILPIGQRG